MAECAMQLCVDSLGSIEMHLIAYMHIFAYDGFVINGAN